MLHIATATTSAVATHEPSVAAMLAALSNPDRQTAIAAAVAAGVPADLAPSKLKNGYGDGVCLSWIELRVRPDFHLTTYTSNLYLTQMFQI